MKMNELLEKTIDFCAKMENHYSVLAYTALEKGNMTGCAIHTSESSSFTRVRMFIQLLLEKKDVNENE